MLYYRSSKSCWKYESENYVEENKNNSSCVCYIVCFNSNNPHNIRYVLFTDEGTSIHHRGCDTPESPFWKWQPRKPTQPLWPNSHAPHTAVAPLSLTSVRKVVCCREGHVLRSRFFPNFPRLVKTLNRLDLRCVLLSLSWNYWFI